MKKVNTLQALGVLILLPVLAGFFAACDSKYQPVVQNSDISFDNSSYDEGKDETTLTVTVHIPSILNDTFFFVTWSGNTEMIKGMDNRGQPVYSSTLNVDEDGIQGANIYRTTTFTLLVDRFLDPDDPVGISVLLPAEDNKQVAWNTYPPARF